MFQINDDVLIAHARIHEGQTGKVLDHQVSATLGNLYLVCGTWYLESQLQKGE